jgi:hypothetical protein
MHVTRSKFISSAQMQECKAAALKPFAPQRFRAATWSAGKVGVDCYVKIGKALYSVPWRLMGQQVHARSAGDSVQVMH